MYSYFTIDGTGELEEAQRVYSSKPLDADRIRVNAAADAFVAVSQLLNDASVAYAVQAALDEKTEEIDNAIRYWANVNEYGKCFEDAAVGALIHILLHRPLNWPDPRPIGFQSLFVAECDLDSVTALQKYLNIPSIFEGPPEGTEQLWGFVWKTLD